MIEIVSTTIQSETELDRHNNAMETLNAKEHRMRLAGNVRLVQVTFTKVTELETVMEHIWQIGSK